MFEIKWSERRDSNPRPLDPQSSALTGLRYAPNKAIPYITRSHGASTFCIRRRFMTSRPSNPQGNRGVEQRPFPSYPSARGSPCPRPAPRHSRESGLAGRSRAALPWRRFVQPPDTSALRPTAGPHRVAGGFDRAGAAGAIVLSQFRTEYRFHVSRNCSKSCMETLNCPGHSCFRGSDPGTGAALS